MVIFKDIETLRAHLTSARGTNATIGFVPTMGALHEGHISLIRASKASNLLTVCSIYVNPAQFNNSSDLQKYPRTLEQDVKLLEKEGCEVLFVPSDSEMYNANTSLSFDFGHLDKVLEGKYRPGHFSGVALVVSKLFNIVQPDRVYFGQKDFQQLQIIKHLRNQLMFQLEICSVPIVRLQSGLALSSRNARLSKNDLKQALLLFESLNYGLKALRANSEFSIIRVEVAKRFEGIKGVKLEYFELVDRESLELLEKFDKGRNSILLIAAYIGDVRLIDNMLVE
ncbi:MAG: pantoate--beta-alanine ligase [Cyclobacteriaceae bacterium]